MKIRILLAAAVLSLTPCAAAAADQAAPVAAKVLVDGVQKNFDAYNIAGSNYFKLRDVALALNGGARQFAVVWDASAGVISLKTGAPYIPVGGEGSPGDGLEKTLATSAVTMQLDGRELTLNACNIAGSNYFKLRDLGENLNFNVTWNGGANTVSIDTDEEYMDENALVKYSKSFGSYAVPAAWAESNGLSRGDKYYYLRADSDKSSGSVSIETGRNRYTKDDAAAFRDATYRQLLWQVSGDPEASFLLGGGSVTDKGYTLYIFTIEYARQELTTRQYYILGDYKHALIYETDYHDKNTPSVTDAARAIADNFEWAK
jgi:hypothetical protein